MVPLPFSFKKGEKLGKFMNSICMKKVGFDIIRVREGGMKNESSLCLHR